MNFDDESTCLTADNIWNGGKFLPCSQITGDVENSVPLHVDIPHTHRRVSDLPFEAVLEEYFQFPHCCKLCPLNNPRRKNLKD
jgi:hypothetical protein